MCKNVYCKFCYRPCHPHGVGKHEAACKRKLKSQRFMYPVPPQASKGEIASPPAEPESRPVETEAAELRLRLAHVRDLLALATKSINEIGV